MHLERVKWYAPRVRHVVADVLATPAGARADEEEAMRTGAAERRDD